MSLRIISPKRRNRSHDSSRVRVGVYVRLSTSMDYTDLGMQLLRGRGMCLRTVRHLDRTEFRERGDGSCVGPPREWQAQFLKGCFFVNSGLAPRYMNIRRGAYLLAVRICPWAHLFS